MESFSRVLIVGASGFGRELYWWMQTHTDRRWAENFGGFLDDNSSALQNFPDYNPGVVSSIASYLPQPGDRLVMGLADPAIKLKLAHELQQRGANFITFIHSSALIVPNARIGIGCVLCPSTKISCDTVVGNFVTFNACSGMGHDGQLGDGCTLSAHCDVMGKAKVGRGVFMGSHACILPNVSVGDFARIGAGSVVIRNVRAETTVMGVPAAKLDFSVPTSVEATHRAA